MMPLILSTTLSLRVSPGIFNAWGVKALKSAIGTHLQFVSNTCNSKNNSQKI